MSQDTTEANGHHQKQDIVVEAVKKADVYVYKASRDYDLDDAINDAVSDWRALKAEKSLLDSDFSIKTSRDSFQGAPLIKKLKVPRAGFGLTLSRLLVWLGAAFSFLFGTLWDIIRRRNSVDRQAKRLFRVIEYAGGTLVKIGQQMSVRYDLLPYEYCHELSQLLDNVAPFSSVEAHRIIEAEFGCDITDLFSEFQSEPIGSASIACVFKARLKHSDKLVAVKVQRPHIRETFAADFRVLDWLLGFLEWLSVLRSGYTVNVRDEFRAALMLELDFRREARCQAIFRKEAKRAKRKFTAPQVYFNLSTDRVLIQDYVEGIWLTEILDIYRNPTSEGLARLRDFKIKPKKLARRILQANYWGMYENLIFHADPHPANIMVQSDGELVFVDFGACGVFDKARRTLYRQLFFSQVNDDSWGMVQAILALLEPLPAIDIHGLARDFQSTLIENLIIFKSGEGEWYERTSAGLWISFLGLISKYNIGAPMDILLFARGSLLYDSLAAQLWSDIDFFKEFERYADIVGDELGEEYSDSILDRLRDGPEPQDYLAIQQILRITQQGLFRLDRILSTPYDYLAIPFTIEKSVFALLRFFHFLLEALFIAAIGGIVYILVNQLGLSELQHLLDDVFIEIITHPIYILIICFLLFRHVRQLLFRLTDKVQTNAN